MEEVRLRNLPTTCDYLDQQPRLRQEIILRSNVSPRMGVILTSDLETYQEKLVKKSILPSILKLFYGNSTLISVIESLNIRTEEILIQV